MFRWLLISIAFGFSCNLLAAPHRLEIDSKLIFQGKKVASPRILTTEGKKAKMIMADQKQNREYNLEVTPHYGPNHSVTLKYALAVRENKDEIISRGQIKIPENENGHISLDRGRIQLYLKVKEG